MIDHFATLGQSRRPWLEGEAIKEAFHRRSASLHPDVPGTGDAAQFAALNAAYSILRDPAARLRHLLELTAPEALAATSSPPLELGDLFMTIAEFRRRLDAFLARRNAASSPLARALLATEGAMLRRELAAVRERLETTEAATTEEVRALDSTWTEPATATANELACLFHRLAYLGRWLAQTREALFTLGT
ncbi:MAG: DnaJ domain-containing protein [Chthoniobacteraceae bacterium]